jgi:hypothetical protein
MTYDPLSNGAQTYMAVAREIANRGAAVMHTAKEIS